VSSLNSTVYAIIASASDRCMMCGSTSCSCVFQFAFGHVTLIFFLCWFMWPFIIASDLSRYCLPWCAARLGHVVKLPASIAFMNVEVTDENADACRYCVESYIFENLYTLLFISPCCFLYCCAIALILVLFSGMVHNPISLPRCPCINTLPSILMSPSITLASPSSKRT
jgi:hypothetical protein